MKTILAALAAVLIATTAFADTQVGGAGNVAEANSYWPFTQTPAESSYKHIAVVLNDSTVAAVDNPNLQKIDQAFVFGNVFQMLQNQGAEIHFYSYTWWKTHRAAWQNMGLRRNADGSGGGGYNVTLFPYWAGASTSSSGHGLSQRAFMYACSTSTHIIHFGTGPTAIFNDDDAAGKQMGAGVSANIDWITCTQSTGLGFRVNSNLSDTLFFDRIPFAKTATSGLPTGIAHRVAFFRTFSQTDSFVEPPGIADSLLCGWRNICVNQGNAQTASPYTDFVTGSDGTEGISTMQGDVLYALAAGWLRLRPIKVAMSWADYAEFGGNPVWRRPSVWNSSIRNWDWPRATRLDSVVADLITTYGVKKIVIGTEGDSAASLWDTYSDYAQNPRNWRNNIRFGVHYHNGPDSSGIGRSAFGRGVSNFLWAADSTQPGTNSRRVANATYSPNNANSALRIGVTQSLARSDSIITARGFKTSPFILPGNDALMPIGAFDYPPGTTPNFGLSAAANNPNDCPADSFFNALAATGHTYIANLTSGAADYNNGASVVRITKSNTNSRWPIYPDEIYRTAAGNQIRFMAYNVMSSGYGTQNDMTASGALTSVVASQQTQDISNQLFGLYCPSYFGIYPNLMYGGTAASPPRGTGAGRVRVLGWHVQFTGNSPTGRDTDDYMGITRLLKRLKCMQDLAKGNQLIEWAWPEECYP